MTYRPIGPGSCSATTRADRLRGSPPDQIRKVFGFGVRSSRRPGWAALTALGRRPFRFRDRRTSFTRHQSLRPVQMSLTAFSTQARCTASPTVYSLQRASIFHGRQGWPCGRGATGHIGSPEQIRSGTWDPRSAAAPETSTRPTIEGRAIKRAAHLRGMRSGRIIRVCPAPACQMRHRPGARNHPFTSRGHPVEELREGPVLWMLRPIARLVKRPGNIPAHEACRTGGSPSHHFGRPPTLKFGRTAKIQHTRRGGSTLRPTA
jgi:hypothetical protein